jgi:hypothetical protein
MLNDKYSVDRKFETIFNDAIYFTTNALKSLEEDDYKTEEHFSRAAILNLSLLTEVTANCLLETLNLPSHLFKEVDKFSPITKFEYYLWEKKTIKLDRGCEEVQNIQELQSIRNFLVHPKSKKAEWMDLGDNVKAADFGKTKLLEIPYSSQEWQGDDPFIVLRVVMAFLDYVFRVLCEYSPGKVHKILLSSSEHTEAQNHGYSIRHNWKSIQNKWSLRMKFLGIECAKEKNI